MLEIKKFNKILVLLLLLILLGVFTSCQKEVDDSTKEISKYVLKEEEDCFNFFWETQNVNELLGGCGLIPDRYPSNGLASIASVGYGLAGIVIGVKNKWITQTEGEERAYLTLIKMRDMPRIEGFYYHFYNDLTGAIAKGSEISNIDTSLFLAGALTAGSYFGGRVLKAAMKIYDEVNWPWFLNKTSHNFYMSYTPDTKKFNGSWDFYAEQLIMYFLAAGSTTYPIDKIVYDSFTRYTGNYSGYSLINSWYGSLFTYQFSHAFIDFRKMVDSDGVNWFNNSVNATKANYQYCVDKANEFVTYSKKSWGLTACDTPTGYSGLLGAFPSGRNNNNFKNDGTVAPAGAIGSIVFTPELVIPTINYYATMLDGELVGPYGFMDAFNCEGGRIWIAYSVIGIDKGISLLMIENYRSELIWENFMKLDLVKKAIQVLEFKSI